MSDDTPTVPAPGDWRRRRRIIHLTLLYCATVVAWIVWRSRDSAMESQIAMALVGLATTIIVTYALAATWEDKNKREAGHP